MLTGDMLRRSAHRFPDRPAIRCGRTTMRYRELDAAANRFAHALLGLDLAMGAKVAILSRNLPEYGVVFFGAARTGFVLANVSVRYAPDELAYVLDNADAAVLVYDGSLAGQVAAVQDRLPGIGAYVAIGDPGTVRGAVRFDDFLRGAPESAPDVALDEDDPFCMTYTGGTTGRPKGVLCSHRRARPRRTRWWSRRRSTSGTWLGSSRRCSMSPRSTSCSSPPFSRAQQRRF